MLKISFSFHLAFALLAALLSGCTHYYYAPNSHNVPLFQKEKEARVSVGTSGGDEFEATEFQGAFSVTKHIGIMANGFFVKPDEYRANEKEWGKGNLIEFGAGYFKPINKLIVFETYGGFGWGSVVNQYEPGMKSMIRLRKYFIQPSIGLTSKYIDYAFSARFCGLEFYDLEYDSTVPTLDKEDLEYMKTNKFSILVEPALILRGGWKYFKLQFQIGLSWNLNNPELQQETYYGNFGLYITITDKYKLSKRNNG